MQKTLMFVILQKKIYLQFLFLFCIENLGILITKVSLLFKYRTQLTSIENKENSSKNC